MKYSLKTLVGLILILAGIMIGLGVIGIDAGGLFGTIVSILFIFFGAKMMRRGETSLRRGFGTALLVFGILGLIGSAHFLFGVLFALVVLYIGWKMIKTVERKPAVAPAADSGIRSKLHKMESAFEDEWKRFMESDQHK